MVEAGAGLVRDARRPPKRRVADLADAEQVPARFGFAKHKRPGAVRELPPDVRMQCDAEAQWLTGFGADDGAAEGGLLRSGELGASQPKQPGSTVQRAAE